MNDLEKYFTQNTGRLIDKWKHYFEIYDKHFARFRETDVCIVEFGVYHGGSLQMWKHYFGSKAKIFGIDINPNCKELEEEQINILIGDQEDRNFLKSLTEKIPRIDILLDDGGHTMKQQIATFEELFPHIHENGIYMCEDMHTSYWPEYGGGYKKSDSFVEFSKNFIDYVNAWHSFDTRLSITEFTRTVSSLHYYDSVLAIEKHKTQKSISLQTGLPSFDGAHSPTPEYNVHKGMAEILQQSKAELRQSNAELQQSKAELQQSKAELRQSNAELQQSKAELQQSNAELQQLNAELQQLKAEVSETKKLLKQSHEVWERSQIIIQSMESSKFWKLRKKWFSLKNLFRQSH